jgi:hypothetical protein
LRMEKIQYEWRKIRYDGEKSGMMEKNPASSGLHHAISSRWFIQNPFILAHWVKRTGPCVALPPHDVNGWQQCMRILLKLQIIVQETFAKHKNPS